MNFEHILQSDAPLVKLKGTKRPYLCQFVLQFEPMSRWTDEPMNMHMHDIHANLPKSPHFILILKDESFQILNLFFWFAAPL